MIGNAIPPILTYFIFESMKMTKKNDVIPPNKLDQKLFNFTLTKPIETPPPIPKQKFIKNRNFRFCIPNLRLGSGVRFEMENLKNNKWNISFYYGNSKSIKKLNLDSRIKKKVEKMIKIKFKSFFRDHNDLLKVKSTLLQKSWISKSENFYPFEYIDRIGSLVLPIENKLMKFNFNRNNLLSIFDENSNKKINDNLTKIISGIIIGCTINKHLNDS